MRLRTAHRLPDRADIVRREQTGENDLGEPLYDEVVVAENVRCGFVDGATDFVRLDTGERVQKPATVRFGGGEDVREGDRIELTAVDEPLEVRQVDKRRDKKRGFVTATIAEVERV